MARSRTNRMNKLSNGSSFIHRGDATGTLGDQETKFGNGYNALVIGPNGVRSVNTDASVPGFHFRREDSIIRTGKRLSFTGDHTAVQFSGGDLVFHPLGDTLASTTANPIPTFTSAFSLQATAFISGNGQKAVQLLAGLLL